MHAGWPKFALRAIGWSVPSGALTVNMWAPLTAVTPLGTVTVATDFPFGDVATVTVTPSGSGSALPVWLRIPSWAAGATLSVNGGAPTPLTGSNGTFYPASAAGTTTFTLAFNPQIRLETYYNGAVAVVRGALVYGAWIGQTITVTRAYALNSKDLAITSTTPWNLALAVDRADPGASLTFVRASPPSGVPYNSTDVPVMITGRARVVAGWGVEKNAPAAPPASPACAAPGACGEEVDVTLVPFGSTHVRMAVLPTA